MPGGMGGLGGMLGGLMGGGGGMGGMGGGMMGGMNRNSQQNQQTTQTTTAETSDVYDVDRWKRADGMDDVESKTNVQQVRDAWDRQTEEKKKNSLLTKIKNRFSKKKEEEPPKRNGTITMPEAKKAQKRINNGRDDLPGEAPDYIPPATPVAAVPSAAAAAERRQVNYLGLTCYSDLDGFFTANPVNSAILAVDSLSLGALTLNQVLTPIDANTVPILTAPVPAAAPAGAAPAGGQAADAPAEPARPAAGGAGRNFITQRAGTDYMDAFHESREQRKYEVKIL